MAMVPNNQGVGSYGGDRVGDHWIAAEVPNNQDVESYSEDRAGDI